MQGILIPQPPTNTTQGRWFLSLAEFLIFFLYDVSSAASMKCTMYDTNTVEKRRRKHSNYDHLVTIWIVMNYFYSSLLIDLCLFLAALFACMLAFIRILANAAFFSCI